MITELYVDNYMTLVNFRIGFGNIGVLIGENGCGKSTVFQVIRSVRSLVIDHQNIDDFFSDKTLTRWMNLNVQTIELTINNGRHQYIYHVEIEYNRNENAKRVKKETVQCDTHIIFDEENGHVSLYNDSFQLGAEIVLDWNYSGVSMVAERRDNQLLSEFKRELDKIVVCAPRPYAIRSSSSQEKIRPDHCFSDIVSVYRYLLQSYPEKTEVLNSELRKIFPTYSRTYITGSGGEKTLMFGYKAEGKEIPINVSEISEGELQLFILYIIALYYVQEGYMVFIDEPDNYISLNEIQPWCMMIEECVSDGNDHDGGNGQCIMISHHREIIDYLAPSSGIWMTRNDNQGSSVSDAPVTSEAMSYSDMILFGGLKLSPFQPQTEEQIYARIDHSLAQIKTGNYTDSEDYEEEMMAGIAE